MSAICEKHYALLGFGETGQHYFEVLRNRPELALAGVVEPDPSRRRLAERNGARGYRALSELLCENPALHMAIVCTPLGARAALCERLLLAGADVLVDGPLAPSLVEADQIATRAERLHRLARSVFPFRTAQPIAAARQAIAAGEVGRLCFVEVTLGRKLDARAGWWGDSARSGGGVWMDLGLSALDLAAALGGPVDRLRMTSFQRSQGTAVEDEATIDTGHPHRVRGKLHLTWNEKPDAPLAHCVGTSGDVLIGSAQVVVRSEQGNRVVSEGYDPRFGLEEAVESFLRARLTDELDDTSTLAVSWLRAGYRSVTSGTWEIA